MIIQFTNGSAIDSSIIASIHTVRGEKIRDGLERPPSVVVYTYKEDFSLNMFGRSKPAASHFMSISMPSDLDAENECRRLVAQWMGMPAPESIKPVAVK